MSQLEALHEECMYTKAQSVAMRCLPKPRGPIDTNNPNKVHGIIQSMYRTIKFLAWPPLNWPYENKGTCSYSIYT